MRLSQLLAGLVVGLAAVWLAGALVTLVLNLRFTTVVVAVVLAVAVVAASALGARSRRWLANPYW